MCKAIEKYLAIIDMQTGLPHMKAICGKLTRDGQICPYANRSNLYIKVGFGPRPLFLQDPCLSYVSQSTNSSSQIPTFKFKLHT